MEADKNPIRLSSSFLRPDHPSTTSGSLLVAASTSPHLSINFDSRLLTLITKSLRPVTRLFSLHPREARHPSTPALEMPSRTTPSPRSSSVMPKSPSRSRTPSRFVQLQPTLRKFSRLISCSFRNSFQTSRLPTSLLTSPSVDT